MQHTRLLLVAITTTTLLLAPLATNAAEVSVHSLVLNPKSFDHQTVTLEGRATSVKETTSQKRNDYTTFKLQDQNGSDAVSIFSWGHPALTSGDHVRVDGIFEIEHHQGKYTFYNEVEATKIVPLPR